MAVSSNCEPSGLSWKPFDVAQSFIEYSARASSIQALASSFQASLEELGFRYYACCSHVNPARPPPGAVIIQNYPTDWVNEFIGRQLFTIDPVLKHAESTLLPFHWDCPQLQRRVTEPQKQILSRAATFGLFRGYTVPLHLPWTPSTPRASCSFVPDTTESIDQRTFLMVQLMAMHLYDAASRKSEPAGPNPRTELSVRERQCLELVAQGKSDWAISLILGISEHTVHRHIERLRRRLGVATRVQAIVRALRDHQISFGDAIRAESVDHRQSGDSHSMLPGPGNREQDDS